MGKLNLKFGEMGDMFLIIITLVGIVLILATAYFIGKHSGYLKRIKEEEEAKTHQR